MQERTLVVWEVELPRGSTSTTGHVHLCMWPVDRVTGQLSRFSYPEELTCTAPNATNGQPSSSQPGEAATR